ncbi:unnamed protein product, partial [Staurois parvus]
PLGEKSNLPRNKKNLSSNAHQTEHVQSVIELCLVRR